LILLKIFYSVTPRTCLPSGKVRTRGQCLFFEKMFESRMYFVDHLIGMGAKIVQCDPHRVVVTGPTQLVGSTVTSPDIRAGIVKWPMSVIRLRGKDRARIAEAGDKILSAWRNYDDEAAFIFHETDGEAHNTITPIARRRGEDYELDLVLRNNITTKENPLGVYHPHADKHHIKKENIGLIEVMGLAVLPARLKNELAAVAEGLVSGKDLSSDPLTASHAEWAKDIQKRYPDLNSDNVNAVVEKETGLVFAAVLEDAGVYKHDEEGRKAFDRFIASL